MDKIVDFSQCKRVRRSFGGSDRKLSVKYNDNIYMLKFSEHHAKKHDISTSYVNNAIAEYISSHISQSAGLPTHDTVLGEYNNQIVVGCKDFRKHNEDNIEFSELMHTTYDSKDIDRVVNLSQIYNVLKDPDNDLPEELQKLSIQRYWDTFVIDALVGNFDRHIGNWGYIINKDTDNLSLAPVYDYGSTLFPQLSDEGANQFINNDYELLKRCMVFPSPALFVLKEKVGKVGYYDLLASNYDNNCTQALLRIKPKININDIYNIIDNTPFLSKAKACFYKQILLYRKILIIDRAYEKCLHHQYDKSAYNRIISGQQYSEELLKREKENLLAYYNAILEVDSIMPEYCTSSSHTIANDTISTTNVEVDSPQNYVSNDECNNEFNEVNLENGEEQGD